MARATDESKFRKLAWWEAHVEAVGKWNTIRELAIGILNNCVKEKYFANRTTAESMADFNGAKLVHVEPAQS